MLYSSSNRLDTLTPSAPRQLRQVQHRNIPLAPLHGADVSAVKVGFEG
jgi:hypothetical protein